MPRGTAVGNDRHGLVGRMRRVFLQLHVKHRGQTTQALSADAQGIHFLKQLHAQPFGRIAGSVGLQLVHVQWLHQGFFGQQHGLLWRTANAHTKNARWAPTRAHGGHHAENPVHDGVGRVEHGELRLGLTTATLGGDFNLYFVSSDDLGVYHGGGIVLGIRPSTVGVGQHRTAQDIVWVGITAPHTLVNHVFKGHVRVPLHVHANTNQHVNNAGILTDWPLTNGAHTRVHQHLSERGLSRWRFLAFPRSAHGANKIRWVIVRNKLQRVGDALNQIILLDNGHERLRSDRCGR